MRTASSTYNSIIANDSHRFEVKINIAGVDYGEDKILSCKTDSKVFSTEPTIGGVYSSTLEFSILDDGANIPRMAKVIPYFRATDGTNTSEWIKFGEFYIDTRTVSVNSSGVSVFDAYCYDSMLLTNANYSSSSLNWPATDTAIVAEICTKLGLTQSPFNAEIMVESFYFQLPTSYTYREMLSFIAAAYAANWIIDDEGRLTILLLAEKPSFFDAGSNVTTLTRSPERGLYTKVIMHTGDITQVEAGTSDDRVIEVSNPMATQEMVDYAYEILSDNTDPSNNYSYRPFDAVGVWSDPLVELGDTLRMFANERIGVIWSRTINFGSGMVMDLSAPNDNYIDHEYAYESPEERQYKRTIAGLESSITIAEGGIELLSKQVNNIGGRNLMINTLAPSVATIDDLPRVVGQPYHTVVNDWVPSVAEHGFTVTKGTITQNGLVILFGTQAQEYQSNLGLTPGETYTISFGAEGKLLSNVRQNTYLRFSVGTWDSGGAASADRFTLANFTPGQLFSEKCKATFTIPTNAVNTILQIDVRYEGSGTEPTQYLATDYLELTNIMLEQGEVATAWTPAPEDLVGNDEIIAKINISPEQIVIDANKVNLRGYVTFTNLLTSGQTTINGANITTGLITDALGKNSWNLNTGAFTITDGTINITTSSDNANYIILNGQHTKAQMSASSFSVMEASSPLYGASVVTLTGMYIAKQYYDREQGIARSTKFSMLELGKLTLGGNGNAYYTGVDGNILLKDKNGTDSIYLDGATGSITATNGTNNLTYTPGLNNGLLALIRGSNYTFLLWPDSNGAGRLILGDGTSTKWRTELTNSGLVFRDASDAVTAQYHGNRAEKLVQASPSAVTTISSSDTLLGSVTLGAGLWMITATCAWANNGTGRRTFRGQEQGASASGWSEYATGGASSGGFTTQNFTVVKNYSSQTVYELYGEQTSGNNLNATMRVQAVQIA